MEQTSSTRLALIRYRSIEEVDFDDKIFRLSDVHYLGINNYDKGLLPPSLSLCLSFFILYIYIRY
jgi:hypothetical protein